MTTAAASWFSVRAEMKVPMAINAAPIRSRLIRHPTSSPVTGPMRVRLFVCPLRSSTAMAYSGMKLTQDTSRVAAYSDSAAKNLPSTMPVSVTGAVSSSCSVRSLRSSENRRMVSRGIRMISAKII